MVGWLVGCAVNPSLPLTLATSTSLSAPAGGLSNATPGEGANRADSRSLTPNPSPNGRGERVITPSRVGRGERVITPSRVGRGERVITPSRVGRGESGVTPSLTSGGQSDVTPSLTSGGESSVTPSLTSGGESDVTPSLTSGGESGVTPSLTSGGESDVTPSLTSGGESGVTPSPMGLARQCEQEICILEVVFPFQRPIQPPGTDTVDPTYRYGSTQNGHREVHHGVEFINKAGVPVYAVADGVVEFAGKDEEISLATKRGFYGKVIILKHILPGVSAPIYTVYGHVLTLLVRDGERVEQGQQIGEVGLGGVAAGTHLHFEVRYGANEYHATRNPEMWLPPAVPNGGVLIGRFLDSQNECLTMENIVLEPLGTDEAKLKRRYFSTYEDPEMRCLLPWKESFGINDLPAGRYRLSYIYTKPEMLEFEIVAGKVTYLNLHLP
ncbi:MAG: hypothetical protein Kow0088_17880 [Anaerolineales bacterium]